MKNDFEFESDWKLFRERIPIWQERYMKHLLQEYADIIAEDTSACKRFWKLDEKIKEDRFKKGVSIYERRSTLLSDVAELINEGAINFTDLDGFSSEFLTHIRNITQ